MNRRRFSFGLMAAAIIVLILGIVVYKTRPLQPHALTEGNAALSYQLAITLLPKSQQDDDVYDDWEGPGSIGVGTLFTRCRPSMDALRQGAWMDRCDWQLDYSQGMEVTTSAPLKNVQRLAKAAGMVSTIEFQSDDAESGVTDTLALMRLSRHLQMNTPFVHRLLGNGCERMAMDVLARHMGAMPPKLMRLLSQELLRLPAAPPLTDSLGVEKRMVLASFERSGKEMGGKAGPAIMNFSAWDVAAGFDEAAKIIVLPPDQFPVAWQEFKDKHAFSQKMIGSLDRVRKADDDINVRRALFLAAVAVCLDGKQTVTQSRDPASGAPFEYRDTPAGFQLLSKRMDDGEPIMIQFDGKH